MARWDLLTERLITAQDRVRLTWSELEGIVEGLPPSAVKHRAWWSGDRSHVRAWRSAGFVVSDLVMGREVTFTRSNVARPIAPRPGMPTPDLHYQPPYATADDAAHADVLLVTCVKTKLTRPAAAKDLYVSELFKRERTYAERLGVPWFILSAQHGLVAPDEWLAPYERYLSDTSATYRTAWAAWVAERLELLTGSPAGKVIEIHAGAPYVRAIEGPLTAKGATVLDRLAGLGFGARLQWYHSQDGSPPITPDAGGSHADAASFVAMLLEGDSAVAPADFLAAKGVGLKEPGLYSWWVDDAGAADLAEGLDLPITSGLIYAGLAGATRWPSGKRSTNTLWSRIAGMHLAGRHEFSTFRRTLGSILANRDGRETIDETGLTGWMTQHLRVLALPYRDADSLGRLEDAVLKAIDPPLNLQGMSSTPVRLRLRELRRPHR